MTRPVACTGASASNEVLKELTINLKGNLLRKDLSKLDLCVKVVVGGKILSLLWGPLGLELLGNRCDGHRVDLDVELRELIITFEAPVVCTLDGAERCTHSAEIIRLGPC